MPGWSTLGRSTRIFVIVWEVRQPTDPILNKYHMTDIHGPIRLINVFMPNQRLERSKTKITFEWFVSLKVVY